MFRVFIDESGNDAREPVLVVAALVGSTEDWENFAEEWQLTLEASNPKPLAIFKDQRYFKHSEARGHDGCFVGFSNEQAEQKTINLASVITRHNVGVFGFMLERALYFRIVDEMVVKKSGRLYRNYIKDPLYISLHRLVEVVLHTQYAINPNDNVDFIFDSGEMSNRVISVFEFIRKEFSGNLPSIMGTLITMDDKKVMPLQAVDLLAGQLRMATEYEWGRIPSPLGVLKQVKMYWVQPFDEETIRAFFTMTNISSSIRTLSAIKREREKENKG